MHSLFTKYPNLVDRYALGPERKQMIYQLLSLLDGLETDLQLPQGVSEGAQQVTMIGNFISTLKPITTALVGSISDINSMRMMIDALKHKVQGWSGNNK